MKKITFLSCLFTSCFLWAFTLSAQNEDEICLLTIKFETPEKSTGRIYFLVFNDPESFGDEKNAYNYGIVNPPQVTLSLPYGEYAVTCFQDTHNEGKITTNFLGIPKEPVGSSDNPKLMRAPKWKDSSFKVDQPTQEITINLKKIF